VKALRISLMYKKFAVVENSSSKLGSGADASISS